jgi:Fic family protein
MSTPTETQAKYQDIINEIDRHYKIMKSMRPLNSDAVKRYLEEFSISASHNSNAIEGNSFTYDETRLLLKEGVTSSARSFEEHQEIVGYKKGFDFLYAALKNNQAISEALIKKIHQFILSGQENAGQYRQEQVYIGDMFNITFTPCPADLVSDKMKEYAEAIQKDMEVNKSIKENDVAPDWYSLFNNLARHHIEFEKIHPFIDGNGRTGRLLLIYEMIYTGLLPIDVRYEERSRYYAALKDYDIKAKYSSRLESKTEGMAKLLAESELKSMGVWNEMFKNFIPNNPISDE